MSRIVAAEQGRCLRHSGGALAPLVRRWKAGVCATAVLAALPLTLAAGAAATGARLGVIIPIPSGAIVGPTERGDEVAAEVGRLGRRVCDGIRVWDLAGRLRRTLVVRGRFCPMLGESGGFALFASGRRAVVFSDASSQPEIRYPIDGFEHQNRRPLAHYDASTSWDKRYQYFGGGGIDRSALLWGWWSERARIREDEGGGCTAACRFRVGGGGIARWKGGRVRLLRAAPPAATLAAGSGLAAVDTFSSRAWSRAIPGPDRIEVVRTDNAARVASIPHRKSEVLALAVSSEWLAAVLDVGADPSRAVMYLELWRLPQATLVRRLRIQGLFFPEPGALTSDGVVLSLRGGLLAIGDGYSVGTLRLPAGKLRLVARHPYISPRAIALAHQHVAWATCDSVGRHLRDPYPRGASLMISGSGRMRIVGSSFQAAPIESRVLSRRELSCHDVPFSRAG